MEPRKAPKRAHAGLPRGILNTGSVTEWMPLMKLEASALLEMEEDGQVWFEPLGEASGSATHVPAPGTLTAAVNEALEKRLSQPSHNPIAVARDPVWEQVEHNMQVYESLPKEHPWRASENGAIALNLNRVECLKLYAMIVQAYEYVGPENLPAAILKPHDSPRTFDGGFGNGGYTKVDAPLDIRLQTTCVFAVKSRAGANALGKGMKPLIDQMAEDIRDIAGCDVKFNELHIVFGFSGQAQFTYHTDEQGQYTVVVQLSPGCSSIKVAAEDEDMEFKHPGDAFLFPSQVYHRSGVKERRTITVSFFFEPSKPRNNKVTAVVSTPPAEPAAEAGTPAEAETAAEAQPAAEPETIEQDLPTETMPGNQEQAQATATMSGLPRVAPAFQATATISDSSLSTATDIAPAGWYPSPDQFKGEQSEP